MIAGNTSNGADVIAGLLLIAAFATLGALAITTHRLRRDRARKDTHR